MKKAARLEPRQVARLALARLRKMSDPVKAAGAQAYFKDTVKCFGVAAPDLRSLAGELFASVKGAWTLDEAVELCRLLLPRPELEAKAVAILVFERFKKDFHPGLLPVVKGWLEKDWLDNWASVDVFCAASLGALIARHPEVADELKRWAFHPNRWVKRASAVSFIKPAKNPEFLPVIYEVAASLFPVEDDLIHKAAGWLLREAGKTDPKRLEAFLLRHGPAVPRTTVRYAVERFPEPKRRRLLELTRR